MNTENSCLPVTIHLPPTTPFGAQQVTVQLRFEGSGYRPPAVQIQTAGMGVFLGILQLQLPCCFAALALQCPPGTGDERGKPAAMVYIEIQQTAAVLTDI